ncbi:unnamed protein product, partial [Ectocarpus sp. 6 AP-2014]
QTLGATLPRHDFEAATSVNKLRWLLLVVRERGERTKQSKSEVCGDTQSVDGATDTAARVCRATRQNDGHVEKTTIGH